jgi:hypothetical protein
VQPARQLENPSQHPVWQSTCAVSQLALQSVHCVASHAWHVAVGAKLHPVAGLHESTVQLMASLQASGAPLVHVPPTHWSPVVQALASLQAVPSGFGASAQAPVVGLQVAFWQGPEAEQTTGLAPRQVPAWQLSVRVHALPSLHAVPFGFAGWLQIPVAGAQTPGSRQGSVALQTTGALPTQAPAWQASTCVQALPSLQVVPLGRN